jgi:hypothetical protein
MTREFSVFAGKLRKQDSMLYDVRDACDSFRLRVQRTGETKTQPCREVVSN